jgi:hypothetical protein
MFNEHKHGVRVHGALVVIVRRRAVSKKTDLFLHYNIHIVYYTYSIYEHIYIYIYIHILLNYMKLTSNKNCISN